MPEIDPIDARLSALEFLVEGLWAQFLIGLPEGRPAVVLQSLEAASGRWALSPGSGPQDVAAIEAKHAVQHEWVKHLLARVESTERLLRQNR